MRIFFGKIANQPKFKDQLDKGYYVSPKDSPYYGQGNEKINIGDYAFIIGGSKIQLWRAKSWGKDRLNFDIIHKNLQIDTNWFVCFKNFFIDITLTVLTARQVRRSFFPIKMIKNLTEKQLLNIKTFESDNNYRNILILDNEKLINPDSDDIQIYIKKSLLHLYPSKFISKDIVSQFKDYRKYAGNGRKMKDNTFNFFNSIKSFPATFTPKDLSFRQVYDAFCNPYSGKTSSINETKDYIETSSLNTILYGPPGTGKTFYTINYALSIIENKSLESIEAEERSELKRRFNEYREKGQIDFITFHQSFSYEDFIEGIKPKLNSFNISEQADPLVDDNIESTISYELKEGVFKIICKNALKSYNTISPTQDSNYYIDPLLLKNATFYKMSLGNTYGPDYEKIYKYCTGNNYVALGYGDDIDFKGVTSVNDIENKFYEKGKKVSRFISWAIRCFVNVMKKGDLVFISYGNSKCKAIGVIDGDYQFNPNSPISYYQFRKVKWLYKDVNIPVEDIYESKFSQQSIYQLWTHKVRKDYFSKQKEQNLNIDNHVLIIDEINRGNIANIFGELITLIEPDKRLGQDEEIICTLPYSPDEEFGVPPNLYILGTMNTADRSVEALDTALRRRFSFIEIKPDIDLLKRKVNLIEGIDVSDLLDKINQRIIKLLDNDHCIGHSYFLELEKAEQPLQDLKNIFRNKIIPLLKEYFYGDYGKIGLILGPEFVEDIKTDSIKFASGFKYDDDGLLGERKIYRIKDSNEDFDNLTAESFTNIYK